MNSFNRVMNTIQQQPVDRVPVIAVLSAYGAQLAGKELPEIYQDYKSYLAAQKAVQKSFSIDMVLAPFDYSVIAEAFGGEIKFYADQPPNLKKPAAKNWQELIKLPLPDLKKCKRLPVMLAAVRALAEEFAGEKPVFAGIPGPCSLPILLLGMDVWLETLLFDPAGAKMVLDYCADFFAAWSQELLAAGTTALIVTEGMAAAEMTTREIFSTLIPHLKATFSRVPGPIVFHHTGGRINPVLDLLLEIPGVLGFVVGAKDNLLEARKIIGSEKLLIGNIDNLRFPRDDSQKIYKRSFDTINSMMNRGPFILSNSGADIPLNTPAENISAMMQASIDIKQVIT